MLGRMRNAIALFLFVCMAAACCASALAAQEPTFRLEADSLSLPKGASGSMVVSLMNAQGAQIVGLDGFENFDILSQSQSTSTSIINNVTTYQEDIYYTIMPKETGTFTVKAVIAYNGQTYETNSLEMTVTEASDRQSGAVPSLFVNTALSHVEAYLGEKVILTYELYTRESIESVGFEEYIAIDGVVAKEVPQDQIKTETVYIDGNRYTKYEIKQLIIDPIKTGVCVIPSYNLQVNVLSDGGMGGFGGFGGFLRAATPKYLQTEEKELLVKPLPLEGKPDVFSGIVGVLTLEGDYSREEVDYGDSLALRLEASGGCNLDGLNTIVGGGIPGFSVYEVQKGTTESIENNQYHVSKAFEAIMVPEKTGVLDVPPVSVSYFNPVSGQYETAGIPGATINVQGDMPLAAAQDDGGRGDLETVRINQVRYAEASDGYFTIRITKELLYAVLIGLAAALLLAVCLRRLVVSRKKRDTTIQSLYKQAMGGTDINEIYGCFSAMLKHCCRVSLKANSKDSIRTGLADASLAAQVADIMDYMESGGAHDEKGTVRLKEKIKDVYASKLRKMGR